MFRYWLALVTLLPATAVAQPVFFDDFDGNALLPHWYQPPPSVWEYNVSNSVLNVTGLFYPSNPKSPGNSADLKAAYAPQIDFRIDSWMGWDAGPQPHRLALMVLAGPAQGAIIAQIGFRNETWAGPNPLIFASANGQVVNIPAPAAGIHSFTITRVGTQFAFYLNSNLFATLPGSATTVEGINFEFVGPYPGQLGAFHIDRVQVVPVPGTTGILLLVFAMAGCRHRTVETLHV